MDLLIKGTRNTPDIRFNSTTTEWVISGRSYPREPWDFYEPVMKWLDELENNQPQCCDFQFRFEFLNTGSYKIILDILLDLKKIQDKGKTQLSVKWFYENDDEDMRENGESLMAISNVPLEFVSY